jgi:hypothetical protein
VRESRAEKSNGERRGKRDRETPDRRMRFDWFLLFCEHE